MSSILKGGTGVVTGAASGIGRATAVALARDGCVQLSLGDLNQEGLKETKRIIASTYPNANVQIGYLDVSKENSVEEFFTAAVGTYGRIDFAVNVAGYAQSAVPAHELSQEENDKAYSVNQRGVFLCHRFQLRQMLTQEPLEGFESRGNIVTITSMCATSPMLNLSGYSGSKNGALAFVKCDALDYAADKIRLNSIGPGYVATPMLLGHLGEEGIRQISDKTPWGRMAKPEDIANTASWLVSPRASFITGIHLPVDGGLNLSTGPP